MHLSQVLLKNGFINYRIISMVVCFILLLNVIPVLNDFGVSSAISNEDSGSSTSRSRSGPVYQNEQEPNDNFAQATLNNNIICPATNPLKCNGTLNPTSDQQDYWDIQVNQGSINVNKGVVVGTNNPDKFKIQLVCISISSGCMMYMYDADKHLTGTSNIATIGNNQEFNIIAQVNSSIFIEVIPNSGASPGDYQLVIDNFTESLNPAFDDKNRFSTAVEFNITQEYNSPGLEDLSYTHDLADFYKFFAFKDQTVKIIMTISTSTADFGLQLFDKTDPTDNSAMVDINDARQTGGTEKIEFTNPKDQMLYLRCFAPIDTTRSGSEGKYMLQCTGNLAPKYNSSFQDTYQVYEDASPLYVDLTPAFYEWNPLDGNKIRLGIFNEEDGYFKSPTGISFQENATIELMSNKSIKITPNTDKYGTEIIQIRATDDEYTLFTYHNFTLDILPLNDLPTLNGTNKWLLGPDVIYDSKGTKVFCDEGGTFDCTVTAWDPKDPTDIITLYDETDMFDINRITGKISFRATYHYTGTHKIPITARDNGLAPNETTKLIEFIINPSSEYPIVSLESPSNDSIQFTLIPEFRWRQTNIDYFNANVTYDLYISTDETLVRNRDPKAHNGTFEDITEFKLISELDDLTRYYWTVIPNDGIHLGKCESESGVFTFYTDIFVEIPEIKLIFPENNMMWDQESITLRWAVDYGDTDPVYYDVYFGVTEEQLKDPFEAPWVSKITETSYKIVNLYFGSYYYWKIVPYTDKVRGNESDIRSIFVIGELPRITLNNPAPGTIITPTESLMLRWTIEYIKPSEVICELYWGIDSESIEKASVTPINVGNKESYLLTGLTEQKYFWYVVPYFDALRGLDSEIWTFEIAEIEVPITILQSPPNTTLYSSNIRLEWKMSYNEDYDPKNVWFDIYLDNKTDNIQTMELVMNDWQRFFYDIYLDFEENLTYYWCVIPRVQTSDGNITGICQSGVNSFIFGKEGAKYKLTLEMVETKITVPPDSKKTAHFIVKNTGNIKTKAELSWSTAGSADITVGLTYKTYILQEGEEKKFTLDISAPPNAELKDHVITVTATSAELSNVTASDSISVTVGEEITDGGGNGEKKGKTVTKLNYPMIIVLILVIVIPIVIVTLLLVMRKKKKSAEASSAGAPGQVEGPPEIAPPSRYGVGATAVAASTEFSSAGQSYAPVQPVAPVTPVSPVAPVTPVTPVQPVQAVKPVQAVQPLQAVKPVQAVQPVQAVKPVQAVQPVKAVPKP